MKPSMVADEMFPEGAGPYMDLDEAGGSGGLLMDLTANEKAVHADFHNDFDDLFDDEDLSWELQCDLERIPEDCSDAVLDNGLNQRII